MRRREFITLGGSGILPIVFFIGLAMFPANSQEKTWRLGLLTPGAAEPGTPGSVRETTLRVLADRVQRGAKSYLFACGGQRTSIALAATCQNALPSSTST